MLINLKKIELYLKQLANIMINDYVVINNNCINFLLIGNDKQKLVELFIFNYAINCKVVEKLIIEGSTKKIKLLTNIITLEKIIDDYNKLLYVATVHDQIDILKHLLEISTDKKSINVPNQNGLTVFTCAIINANLAAAKVLLKHGAG